MPTRPTNWRRRLCQACLAGTLLLTHAAAQEPPPTEPLPPPTLPGPNGPGGNSGGAPVLPPPSAMTPTAPKTLAPQNSLEPVVIVTSRETHVDIVERLSKAIELEKRILRVDGFDPEIIDVQALAPNRIRVQAILQGVTNVVMTDEDGQTWQLNVFVQGDARHLQAIINARFPESSVEAYKVQDAVALTGWVSRPSDITQIAELAEQFYPRVLNHMQVGGVQQVKMKVKIVEVQRSKLKRMGFDFLTSGQSGFISNSPSDLFGVESISLTPGVGSAVELASEALTGTTAFGFVTDHDALFGFLDALREEELLKILAEPALVTTNGRPAMMLAGGEFPVLVPQAFGTLSIEWRDFGVRMEAVPMILGDGRVRLEVMPEVSERDFANSVTLNGSVVPALTTRRVNTQVEMRFGQTLMLAGLISSRQTASTAKIPLLGEIPWAGALFRRVQYEDVETELVVLITPELVAPLDPSQVPAGGPGRMTTFPSDRELFFDGYIEVPRYGDECHGHGGSFGNGSPCGACASCAPTMGKQNRVFQMPIIEQQIPMPDPGAILGPLGSTGMPTDPRAAATRGSSINPLRRGQASNQFSRNRPSGSQGWQTQVINGTQPAAASQPTGDIRPVGASMPAGQSQPVMPATQRPAPQLRTPTSNRRPGLIAPP